MIISKDGVRLEAGERAFNYYDREPGTIGNIYEEGWFEFWPEDKTRATLLNGERVCSIEFAQRKGWM